MLSVSMKRLTNIGFGSSLSIKIFDWSGFTLSHNQNGALKATLRAVLNRSDLTFFYSLDNTLEIKVYYRGRLIWRGRTESVGIKGNVLTLDCLGFYGSWRDNVSLAPYAYADYDRFMAVNSTMGSALATSTPERYTFDFNNRVYGSLKINQPYNNANHSLRLFMKPFMRSSLGFIGLQMKLRHNLPSNWNLVIQGSNEAFSSLTTLFTEVGSGVLVTKHFALTFSSAASFGLTLFNNTGGVYTNTLADGVYFFEITELKLVTLTDRILLTTLTAAPSAGSNVLISVGSTSGMYVGQDVFFNSGSTTSEVTQVLSIVSATQFRADLANSYSIGQNVRSMSLYNDQVIRHIVSTYGGVSNVISNNTGGIDNTDIDRSTYVAWGVPMSDPLKEAVKLGDRSGNQWGLYLDDDLRMNFKQASTISTKVWYVYIDELDIRRLLESLNTVIVVFFKLQYGNDQRSNGASNANATERYGVTRVGLINNNDTTSETEANYIRDTALADRSIMAAQTEIRTSYIIGSNGAVPGFYEIRPWDKCVIANLPPSTSPTIDRIRSFLISETSINEKGELRIIPSLPIPKLENLLTKRSYGY